MSLHHSHLKRIPIFLASSSDLSEERKLFNRILEEVNTNIAKPKGLLLEAIVWEDTLIGKGRPQSKINEDLKQCNLVVLLLWKKWGSPTGKYSSGFEEEYEVADENSKDIWLYFREVTEDMMKDPGKQLEKVLDFKKKIFNEKKYFSSSYIDEHEWTNIFSNHLGKWLNQMRSESVSKENKPEKSFIKNSQNNQKINRIAVQSQKVMDDNLSKKENIIKDDEIQYENITNARIRIGNSEVPYLKIDTIDYLSCSLFCDSRGFSNGIYHFHSYQGLFVPLEKLKNILNLFYTTFRTGYELDNPSFIINQTCFKNNANYSWFGYGPKNLVKSLKEQSKRYSNAGIVKPHHSEVAGFVAEGPDFIFYIAFSPAVNDFPIALNDMQVGFIFENMPFNNRKFIDFYKTADLEEPGSIYQDIENFNVEKLDLLNKNINLKRNGFVTYKNRYRDDDWVSKVIFENPFYGNKSDNSDLTKHNKIVVNLIDHQPLESDKMYHLKELRVIPIPYGNFEFKLLNIIGNW